MPPNLADFIEHFDKGTYVVSEHAAVRMIQRGIAAFRLEDAIADDRPEIIEDIPRDSRGPCCIVLGFTHTNQPLHARIGYGQERPILITTYDPRTRPEKWSDDWKTKHG